MAMGPLGVQNGMEEWTDIVEGTEEYCLSVLVQELEGSTSKVALLTYRSDGGQSDKASLWKGRAPAGCVRFVLSGTAGQFLLCETTANAKTADRYRDTLKHYRFNPQ